MTPAWRTSSYCSEGNACLVVITTPDGIRLRESDTPGPTLAFTTHHLARFIRTVKAGRFDREGGRQ
ncbi:DUF397 domain-containing protein [Streptomyces stramineus]|uniref:DUF397 domain-containing protein n=1 Tax=Streptomyces stramineus TaxID=173861 RepID=A0ABP3JWW1_9ACTN